MSAASARPLVRETPFLIADATVRGRRLPPKGSVRNTGSPQCVVRDDQPDACEGQTERFGVEGRFVASLKAGNAGKGRNLSPHRLHALENPDGALRQCR